MTKKLLFSFIGLIVLNLSAQMKIDTLSIENYQIRTSKISNKLEEISSLEFYQDFFGVTMTVVGNLKFIKLIQNPAKLSRQLRFRMQATLIGKN